MPAYTRSWSGPQSVERLCDRRHAFGVAGPRRVDADRRSHRGRERERADVPALGARRLGLEDLVHDREIVLEELGLAEGLLPDDEVDVPGAVGPVLDLSALDVGDGL